MNIRAEDIEQHIPYYLTREAKDGLIKALKDFPDKMNYYTGIHDGEILQGDAWTCFDVIDFETAEKKLIKGIILSNSCDISQNNSRAIPARIVFAPIIPLNAYKACLERSDITQGKVDAKLTAIREQKVTSLFYLPCGRQLEAEHIAILDDLHNLPAKYFHDKPERKELFKLSQAGFYLFLLKISIHFCRFHENVLRGYGPATKQHHSGA